MFLSLNYKGRLVIFDGFLWMAAGCKLQASRLMEALTNLQLVACGLWPELKSRHRQT
jgi:hypothetical protein